MSKNRSETAIQDKWNVEALFPSLSDWQKEFSKIKPEEENPSILWKDLAAFRGRLGESPKVLKEALSTLLSLEKKLSTLYTYAHLRHDEEITLDEHKTAYNRARTALYDLLREASWFQPELISLPESTIKAYMSSPELAEYHFYLDKIFRLKPYTLSEDKEELLALAQKALATPSKTFSALNDADFIFDSVKDSEDKTLDLTHAKYSIYMRSKDRLLRANAFKTYHKKFDSFQNTLAELIEGQTQVHFFSAKSRGFKSCLQAALYPNNIDTSVYTSLIQAVHKKIGALHHYMAVRSKLMHQSPLHMYDLHVSLIPEIEIKISYAEAEELVIDSVAPLGGEYQNILKKGLKEDRWVDRYENKNKRSGAYSSGCYGSMPYILMNYKEIIRDTFVLAHEVGHSMHSYMSHKHQPYHYSDYPIFLAEVASTFNEELLMQKLLEKYTKPEEKAFLINQKIEDIRNTLFRQTMFAEFELKIHELVEKGVPLTPKLLKEEYRKLNLFYFGPSVHCDEEIDIEWARIPHFYYNFYVFQYATGISAAIALNEKVLNGSDKEREDYLNFLKGGSSLYPIDLLLKAGVDMRQPQPVIAAIEKFEKLVGQLEKELI